MRGGSLPFLAPGLWPCHLPWRVLEAVLTRGPCPVWGGGKAVWGGQQPSSSGPTVPGL